MGRRLFAEARRGLRPLLFPPVVSRSYASRRCAPCFSATQTFSTSPCRRNLERQWSTPLAKRLFEAISVRASLADTTNFVHVLKPAKDNGTSAVGQLHENLFDWRFGRLLHGCHRSRPRPIWCQRGFRHVSRDLPNFRRAHWHLVCCRMDVPAPAQAGRSTDRGWAGTRYPHG